MQRIQLFTKAMEYVATVEIPPFKEMPDIVRWGNRTFLKSSDTQYKEVFEAISLTESPGLECLHDARKHDFFPYACSLCRQPTAKEEPPPVDRTQLSTIHGGDPAEVRERQKTETGMHSDYIVLSDEERARGFVRPVRDSYKHVGRPSPKNPLLDLTPEQQERFGDSYAKFEKYPPDSGRGIGRYWTQEEIDKINKGCGSTTTMGTALAETYARDPKFYGATYCARCGGHFPVGEEGEFVWSGTTERVGT